MSAVLYFNSLSSLARAAWSLPLSNIEILIVDTLTMYMGLQRYTVVAAVTDTPCCKYTWPVNTNLKFTLYLKSSQIPFDDVLPLFINE